MNFNFEEKLCLVAGMRAKYYVDKSCSPNLIHNLINSPGAKVFHVYTNPCLAEIEVYKIKGGHIVRRIDSFTNGAVFKTERDFYVSNVLSEGIKEKYINTTYPRHRLYYGKSCKKIRFLEIDEEHAKMLIITGDEVSPGGLFHAQHPIIRTVYGDYLYAGNRLFYTIEDLNDYLEIFQIQWTHFRKPTQSDRCVAGRNIYGEHFVENIPLLMDQLAEALRAPREWFDFSIEHRDKVQLYLFRNIITDEFADQVYLPLLAYCGEMHRSYYKSGEWVVDYDPVLDCWNPDIRRADGAMARMDRPLHRILDSTSAMYYPLWAVVAHQPTY